MGEEKKKPRIFGFKHGQSVVSTDREVPSFVVMAAQRVAVCLTQYSRAVHPSHTTVNSYTLLLTSSCESQEGPGLIQVGL